MTPDDGALPTFLVIGAMKCGTSALHNYLALHPQIAMSRVKELNFFLGDPQPPPAALTRTARWDYGNWHRPVGWYLRQFSASHPVRGESSPGYTSPSRPGTADRIHRLIPQARLVYLVRDPVERAVSQYRHHRREGSERRSPAEALTDSKSQYVSRGRYFANLQPYLRLFDRAHIAVVAAEELAQRRRVALRRVFAFLGVDDSFWCEELGRRWHVATGDRPPVSPALRDRLAEGFRDDAAALRAFTGRDFSWSV